MNPQLSARGISQRFGDRVVLDAVDLDVPPGRVVGLLGPNGAGKTTLMRILFGVLAPDAGTLSWHDRAVTDDDRRAWGYMPQERGLYRDMRVLDLLVWIARLHGLDRDEGRRRARALLEQLDLAARTRTRSRRCRAAWRNACSSRRRWCTSRSSWCSTNRSPASIRWRCASSRTSSPSTRAPVATCCSPVTSSTWSKTSARRSPCLHHGRVVLHGDLRTLKAESTNRWLRVDVPVDPSWIDPRASTIATHDARGTRLRLEPHADPGAVLDAIRSHVQVDDFGVEAPSLSELFLEAAGTDADTDEEAA